MPIHASWLSNQVAVSFGISRGIFSEQLTIELELPWKGTYMIEVALLDGTPGVHGKEAYDTMRFVTTLTFKVPAGLEAPPRPPVTTPKR